MIPTVKRTSQIFIIRLSVSHEGLLKSHPDLKQILKPHGSIMLWYFRNSVTSLLVSEFQCFRVSEFQCFSVSIPRNLGTLKLWNFGTLELWNFETLKLWNLHSLRSYVSISMALWIAWLISSCITGWEQSRIIYIFTGGILFD